MCARILYMYTQVVSLLLLNINIKQIRENLMRFLNNTFTLKSLFTLVLLSAGNTAFAAADEPTRTLRSRASAAPLTTHTLAKTGIGIIEQRRWRLVERDEHNFPVISDGIKPYSIVHSSSRSTLSMTPVSEAYNNWPQRLPNASLFPFLLSVDADTPYPEFSSFVQDYYKSSCAIVYYPEVGEQQIVGSGAYVADNLVATARHNFNHLDPSRLYVRFFHYEVKPAHSIRWLSVREDFIDVPVVSGFIAREGLDAGYLKLWPISNKLSHKYVREIPPETKDYTDDFRTLPDGNYAMFHFAGGNHLLSVGHVSAPSRGAWIHNNISIEAGPGASGAAIIQKKFSHVSSHGISIYRMISRILPERRVIPFARFAGPGVISDPIAAPYKTAGSSIKMVTSHLDDGYEFLSWSVRLHAGRRANKPAGAVYEVTDENHSVHHIIPCFDLLFMWDYLDPRGDNNFYGYEDFRDVLKFLSPLSLRDDGRPIMEGDRKTPRREFTRTHFAWSWWNLFKGWKGDLRFDDPKDGSETGDRSEKVRPLRFNPELWGAVKELYEAIQLLKMPPYNNKKKEENLLAKLKHVNSIWQGMNKLVGSREIYPKIHEFDSEEWKVRYRDGALLFGVRNS